MTNHAAFAHADAPLFLFHLLEFSGRRLRAGRGGVERPLGRSRQHRQLEPAGHQAHRGQSVDILTGGAGKRHLAAERRRRAVKYSSVSTITGAPSRANARPSSCASAGRRLPLRGRRPRHPGHPGPPHDQELQAQRPGQGLQWQGHRAPSSPGAFQGEPWDPRSPGERRRCRCCSPGAFKLL